MPSSTNIREATRCFLTLQRKEKGELARLKLVSGRKRNKERASSAKIDHDKERYEEVKTIVGSADRELRYQIILMARA